MFRPSSRDLSLVGGLLPLLTREITADPEQHDRGRREARIRGLKQMGSYVRETHLEAERREDAELGARLDGEGVAGPSRGRPGRNARPASQQTAPRSRHTARPSTSASPTGIANAVAHTQRPAIPNGQSFHSNNLTTPDDQKPSQVFPATKLARSAKTNTRDQTLLQSDTAALSKAHTPDGVLINRHASGSFTLSAPDPGQGITLNDKPTPSIGGQQLRAPVRQDAITILPSIQAVIRQSLGHKKVAAQSTALVEGPSPKPAVDSPPHGSGSTVSGRNNDRKQQRRSPEAKLPSDLLHRRDFEVKRIRNKYVINGVILFSVRWKSTWVPLEAIIHGNDHECSYVEADGAKWYIRKELDSRVKNGVQERKVQWPSTREPLENLANAQEAISTFEMTRQQGLDDEQKVRRRTVLTFEESKFPRGIVRPQSERDYAASQRWVACTWPRIRPHSTLDLYPAIYRIQMELIALKPTVRANHQGKSYLDFMRQPQVRSLQWREEYIQSGRSFRFSRRTRAALFLQVTGELDTDGRCTRCLGEKLAPFLGCVRTAASQQSWLGGACANCGTQDSSFCLHHHKGVLGRESYTRTSHRAHDGHHREPANASGVPIVFDVDDAVRNDDADSDDDDSESDSDDEADDEADPDKDARPFDRLAVYASAATLRGQSYELSNAAISSAEAYPSPLSATDPPAAHAGRGKLPKISKTRRVAASASPPPTPPTSQLPQNSTHPDEFGFQPNGAAALGYSQHSVDNSWPHVKSITEILEEDTPVDEEFLPDPLEQDFMELLWTHETPALSIEDRRPNTEGRLERNSRVTSVVAQPPRIDAAARGLEGRRGNELSMGIESPLAATADGEKQLSATKRRKRRADSLEPRPKRPSLDFCGQSSSGPARDPSPGPSTRREKTSANEAPPRTFMSIRSLEKMSPKSIHQDCVAGQPCKNHGGGNRPIPRDPRVKVFHTTLDSKSRITEEQAEYILSRSNCYWAWLFTWIWKLWCDEQGGIDKQEFTQLELLVRCPDKLRGAAWDCCPRGGRLVVEID